MKKYGGINALRNYFGAKGSEKRSYTGSNYHTYRDL